MTTVLDWTDGASVLCVTDLNSSIHIAQMDVRSSTADLSAQIMSDKTMIVYVQAKVIVDAAGNG